MTDLDLNHVSCTLNVVLVMFVSVMKSMFKEVDVWCINFATNMLIKMNMTLLFIYIKIIFYVPFFEMIHLGTICYLLLSLKILQGIAE